MDKKIRQNVEKRNWVLPNRDVEALLWVVVGRIFCCEKYDFSEFCGLCPIQNFFNKIRKLKSNSIFNPELKWKMWTS